jgi:hypothetical protein
MSKQITKARMLPVAAKALKEPDPMWTSDPERMKQALDSAWPGKAAYERLYGTPAAEAMELCRRHARDGDLVAFKFAMIQLSITLQHHVPWVYEKRARG